MTLARKNHIALIQKGERWIVEHRTGCIIVTCKIKANNIYDELCKHA